MKLALTLLALVFLSGCKKEAPYIDSLVGIYTVSGRMQAGGFVKDLNDSLIAISKVDDWTIQFIRSSCDSTFKPISLNYSLGNGSIIQYSLFDGNHSPNSSVIQFTNPPNGRFTYNDGFYCDGAGNTAASLSGIKVQ